MDEKTFWNKYYFNPLQMITVVNPTSEDFSFKVTVEIGVDIMTGVPKTATNEYTIEKGASKRWPGPVVNMYLDQMFKKLVQDKEIEYVTRNEHIANTPQAGIHVAAMSDYGIRAQYYDELIVGEVINNLESFQAYDNAIVADQKEVEKPADKPFSTLEDATDGRNTSPAKPSSEVSGQTSDRAKAVASAKN